MTKTKEALTWTGRTYIPPVFPREAGLMLRNIYHTRVVITEAQTPSRTRYDFQPGEVKAVLDKDAPALLGMQKTQTSCCGGVANLPPIKYFTVA